MKIMQEYSPYFMIFVKKSVVHSFFYEIDLTFIMIPQKNKNIFVFITCTKLTNMVDFIKESLFVK